MAEANGDAEDLATKYWNVNVPREHWTVECPEFLNDVDHWDRAQLGIRDEDYELMSWAEVKELIETNHLECFKRVPSDLRRYRKYIAELKRNHGSVMDFIMKERVRWPELIPKGRPFEYPEDIRILFNDWPYGIDKDIVHLVVWTKFRFAEEPDTGDLMPEARQSIEDFVARTFRTNAQAGDVAWFKNWAALKSVHAVEHFHVMLYRPNADFVGKITDGDISMAARLKGK